KHQYGDTTHTAQPELLTKPVDLPVDIAYISGTLTVACQDMLKTPHGGETTDVRIIKVFEPLTLSSTMVERLASSFMDSSSTSLSISLSSSGTGGCPKGEDPLGQ
ncbi:hypothetical protein N7534_011974, partial [Penicillium rubens]